MVQIRRLGYYRTEEGESICSHYLRLVNCEWRVAVPVLTGEVDKRPVSAQC